MNIWTLVLVVQVRSFVYMIEKKYSMLFPVGSAPVSLQLTNELTFFELYSQSYGVTAWVLFLQNPVASQAFLSVIDHELGLTILEVSKETDGSIKAVGFTESGVAVTAVAAVPDPLAVQWVHLEARACSVASTYELKIVMFPWQGSTITVSVSTAEPFMPFNPRTGEVLAWTSNAGLAPVDFIQGELMDVIFNSYSCSLAQAIPTTCNSLCASGCEGPSESSCLEFVQLVNMRVPVEVHGETREWDSANPWLLRRNLQSAAFSFTGWFLFSDLSQPLYNLVKTQNIPGDNGLAGQRVMAVYVTNANTFIVAVDTDAAPNESQTISAPVTHTQTLATNTWLFVGAAVSGNQLQFCYGDFYYATVTCSTFTLTGAALSFANTPTYKINVGDGFTGQMGDLRYYQSSSVDLKAKFTSRLGSRPVACNWASTPFNCPVCHPLLVSINTICQSEYYAVCMQDCNSCTGASRICASCKGTTVKLSDHSICLAVCPSGYTLSSGVCSPVQATVADFVLEGITSTVNGGNGITGVNGATLTAFPDFESSDPRPAQDRGYHFDSDQFITLPPTSPATGSALVFPPSMTISTWVRPEGPGQIYSKQSSTYNIFTVSVDASYHAVFTGGQPLVTCTSTFTLTQGQWTFLALTFQYNSAAAQTTVTFYLNGVATGGLGILPFLIRDRATTMDQFIGKGFKGFIWRVKFQNYAVSSFASEIASEGCPFGRTPCLSSCNFGLTTDCQSCPGTCANGCLRPTDCGLCSEVMCDVCSGFGVVTCTTCIPHASPTPTCACDSGYFFNSAGRSCDQCPALCASCSNSSSCSVCVTGAAMAGACACTTGFYQNANSCLPCHATCATCSGGTNSQCSGCRGGASLSGTAPSSCVCTAGTFPSPDSSNCVNCHSSCATCSAGSSDCDTCKTSAHLSSTPAPSPCECDSGFFPSPNAGNCLACSALCLTCSGASSSACYSCKAHMNLAGSAPNQCVCDSGYYLNIGAGQCELCTTPCVTCQGSATSCSSCGANAHVENATCVCNAGFYGSGNCQACHVSCFTCSAGGSSGCDSCASPWVLQAPAPAACVCAPGLYASLAGCQPCHAACKTCSEATANSCLSCQNLAALMGSAPSACQCTLSPSSDPANCQGCDGSCATCSAVMDAGKCLSCKSHAALSAGRCTCEIHYYPAPDAGNCQTCHRTCLACSGGGAADCRSCQANATLQSSAPSACTCVSSFYPLPDPSFCNRCAATCKECVQDTSQKCTACWSGAELVGAGASSCTCSRGYFPSADAAHCQPCNSLCTACLAATTECTGCGQYAHLAGPSPSACVCDSNAFLASTKCALCDDSCVTCAAAGPESCRSCSAHSSLWAGACGCDVGYYRVGRDCIACSPLCQTCSTAGNSGCTACGPNSALAASPPASCKCITGYRRDSNNCIKCVNYFDPSTVRASIDASYTKLLIEFPKPVDTAALTACSDIFNVTSLVKLGSDPLCTWSSDQLTLSTLLGTNFTLRADTISLITDNIGAVEVSCDALKRTLALTVSYQVPKAPPVATISVSSVHSPECGPELRISAAGSQGLAGHIGLFKWKLVLLPSTQELYFFDSFSASNIEITLPNSQLQGDQLNVTVFVRDAFGGEASASSLVSLDRNSPLIIALDTVSPIRTARTNSIKVSAAARLPCSSGAVEFVYQWSVSYASSSVPISFNPNSFQLYINAYILPSSSNYRFLLTVTANGFSGNTTISIYVNPTPLVLAFDRSDGQHSADLDLVIDASASRDPDDSTAALRFQWTCAEGSKTCLGASGKVLELAENAVLSVKAANLRVGAGYVFLLTVNSVSKQRTSSIAINIVSGADLNVKIFSETVRVPPGEAKVVYPSVTSNSAVFFQWSQYSGRTLTISTPLNTPWLKIPAGQISTGESYKFSLQVTTGSTSLTQYLIITANFAPAFGRLQCSPLAGEAIADDFLMQAFGWDDPDGTDYPLTYQFGVLLTTSKILYVSDAQLLPEYSSFFFPGTLTLSVNVCDSIKGCATSTAVISVTKPKRMMQSTLTVIKSRFQTAIKTPSKIPSTVIAYAKTVTDVVDQELFSMMLTAINTYLSTLNYSDNASIASQLSCCVALVTLTKVMSVENVKNTGNFIINSLSLSVEKVNDANVQTALAMFTDLMGRSEITTEIMKYNAIIYAYLELVPADSPQTIVGSQGSVTASRVIANDPKNLNLVTPSFKLQFPTTFLSDLAVPPNTICDIRVSQFLNLNEPSPILSVSLFKVGTVDGGNAKQGTPLPLPVTKLANPVSISMPMNKIVPTVSYSAYAKQENAIKWSTAGVNLALISYASTIVQCYHFTSFKVAERHRLFFDFQPWPTYTDRSECTQLYSPVIAASAVLVLCALPALFRCRRKRFIRDTPAASRRDSVVDLDLKASPTHLGDIAVPSQFTLKQPSALSFHPFIGFAFDHSHRSLRVVMATSILLIEEITLGIANSVRFPDWGEDVQFWVSHWEWSDFMCCVCALAFGESYAWVLSWTYSKVRIRRKLVIRCFAACVMTVNAASAAVIAWLATTGCDSVLNRWTAETVSISITELAVCGWIHTVCAKFVLARRGEHEWMPTATTKGNS